jgi:hypothetical protein
MKVVALAGAMAVSLATVEASAALTDSERGQIRSFIEGGELSTVPRLRALVARPDMSEQEAASAMAAAIRTQAFDDDMDRYLSALLFGPSSLASRSVVAPAVVRALLARADTIYSQAPGDPMRASGGSADELFHIHGFVDGMLAQARTSETRGSVGLQSNALRSVAEAYAEHIDRHRRWLGFGTKLEGRAILLRAQTSLVLQACAEGQQTRDEIARTLGLGATTRGFYVRTGALLDDGGVGPEVRLEEIGAILEAVPRGLDGVAMVLVTKTPLADLRSRRDLLMLRTPLGPVAPRRDDLWPESVRLGDPEAAIFEAAERATSHAAGLALKSDTALETAARSAMARAMGNGAFGYLAPWLIDASLDPDATRRRDPVSPSSFVAASATMLLLDARRTIDLAAMRYLSGRPETFEQVELGLRLLVPPSSPTQGRAVLRLGRIGPDGVRAVDVPIELTDGVVTSLELDGHRFAMVFAEDGRLDRVTRDEGPFTLAQLPTARVPTTAGDRWSVGDREFVRLAGHPHLGALGATQIALEPGEGELGAIYTSAPWEDQRVTSEIDVAAGHAGGVLVRGSTGSGGFQGVALMIQCEQSRCSAGLRTFDGTGAERALGREVDVVRRDAGFPVVLEIRDETITATVAGTKLRGRLDGALTPGHVGWVVRSGSRLLIRDWRIEDAAPSTQR